ncbi:MAG: serine/threonine-protein kinase, partial [Methyloceanibacter sp.]
MGAVWKGKDKLKEEARDRNPYVAIKLLQGDFKEHPEAFIALQRETAKQQRLAHPNIATVYDFDRDDATNTVFMTMEVMEGQPMDSYVRKLPAGGLSEEEAMPLIEQLCEGLSYAHKAGLVHSDLKPGNCFYVRGEIVKLLDFGIARASKTKTDAEGEATLFDPGQLGALTPTYATIEMFEGVDPDPRDDIYALAIMAYQFLTGKHPYGKKSAPKAKELGLKVEPIAKLNKRQNKGIERGLAFMREDRTLSVEEFLEQIKKRKSRAPLYAGIAAAVAIVIGALSYNPVNDLVRERIRGKIIAVIEQPGLQNIRQGLEQATALNDPEQLNLILNDDRTKNAIVAYLVAGGERTINETIEFMQQYDETWQREVKDIPAVKNAIFGLYESQIDEAFNVKQNRYVFTTASEVVARLDKIYPDSARVLQIKNGLNREKTEELASLNDKYTRYLEEGRLLPVENEEDIGDVIAIVKQVDPEEPLLKDDRLRFRYGELTEQAIQGNDYGRADNLLKASLAYAPKDAKLNDLRFQVQSELQRIANAKRVEEIERRLGPQFAALKSLADFQGVRDDLVVLADLSPNSKLLKDAQGRMKQAFSAQLNQGISKKAWPENERLLVDFSKLFDIPYLTEQRQLLSSAEQKSGFALKMTPERQAAVDRRVKTIDQLLASPEFSSDWEIKLKIPYKELIALLPLGDPTFEKARDDTARLYLGKAKAALDSERFVEATAFVDRGRVFYPGLKNFTDFQQSIATAEEEWRIRRAEEQRLARIEALKNQVKAAAERNDVKDAEQKLASIKAEGVAADDPYLVEEAPQMLAQAYLRLAQSRAEGEKPDFEQALALAKQGLTLAPDSKPLQDAASTYETEVKKRQLEIALRKRFDSARAIDVAATKKDMAKLKADFPNRYASLEKEFADLRGNRIRGLASAKPPKISEVTTRVKEYNAIFPNAAPKVYSDASDTIEKWIKSVKIAGAKDLNALSKPLSDFKALSSKRYASLSKEIGDAVATKVRALEKTNKSAAAGLLSTAKRVFPGHQKVASIAPIVVPDKNIEQAKKDFAGRLLMAALKNLATAKKRVPDHPDLAPLDEQVSAAKSETDAKYAAYSERAKKPATKTQQKEIEKLRAAARGTCKDCKQYAAIKMVEPRRGACLESLAG